MTEVLREIFELKYDANYTIPCEKNELCDENEKIWDIIESYVGRDTVRTLQDQIWDLNHQITYEWFCEGFRLGAAMMFASLPSQNRVQ